MVMPEQLQRYWNIRWFYQYVFYYDEEIIMCNQIKRWWNGEIDYGTYALLAVTKFMGAIMIVQMFFHILIAFWGPIAAIHDENGELVRLMNGHYLGLDEVFRGDE